MDAMAYRLFYLDFETASELDVRKVGAARYSRHESTFIYCMACAYGNGMVFVYKDQAMIEQVVWEAARQDDVLFVAHNALFEIEIIRNVLDIDIDPERFIDTMAIASHLTMMYALEGVGKIIGIKKLEVGQRLINKLCKLPTKWNPQNAPEDFQLLYEYCKQDVVVSRAFHNKFGFLFPEIEQLVWECTAKINLMGMPVSMKMVDTMQNQVIELKRANDEACVNICGLKTSQTIKLAKFCGMKSVAKVPIRTVLKNVEDKISMKTGEQIAVLKLRKENSLSSLSKLKRVQVLQVDGFIKHGFMYAGASRTGRWSGRGYQPQNLPRGFSGKKLKQTLLKVKNENASLSEISNCIRAVITAKPGFKIYVGDYSQIECRILAYLADIPSLLEDFAKGRDPYKRMSAEIYHKPIDEVTGAERFMGKQCVLACGYGMGGAKFMELLFDTYDVDLDLGTATSHVYQYRNLFYQVPLYWARIENAFITAWTGKSCRVGPIKFFRLGKNCVVVQLISGRKLYYWDVKNYEGTLSYAQLTPNGKKTYRKYIYGGAIVGHICQATSRDITAVATIRFFKAGWHPIGFVHDEILTHDREDKTVEQFEKIMLKPIKWAKGIPITGECFTAKHYQKQ